MCMSSLRASWTTMRFDHSDHLKFSQNKVKFQVVAKRPFFPEPPLQLIRNLSVICPPVSDRTIYQVLVLEMGERKKRREGPRQEGRDRFEVRKRRFTGRGFRASRSLEPLRDAKTVGSFRFYWVLCGGLVDPPC